MDENNHRKSTQHDTPIVSSAIIRDLEAKQEQIIDILKSITPNKLKEGNREITDKLTNVYYHASPNSGNDSPHPSFILPFEGGKRTSDSYPLDGKRTSNSFPFDGKGTADSYYPDWKRTNDAYTSDGKRTSDSYLSDGSRIPDSRQLDGKTNGAYNSDQSRTSGSTLSDGTRTSDLYPLDGKRTSDSQYLDEGKRMKNDLSFTSTSHSRQQNRSPEEIVRDYLKSRKHDSSSSLSLSQQQQKYMFKEDYFRDSKQDSDSVQSPMKNMESLMEPSLNQDSSSFSSSNNKLDQSQINELLALTKMAELTAIKKEGVSHPGSSPSGPKITPISSRYDKKPTSRASKKIRADNNKQHSRIKKVVTKKPRIRGLLRYLIGSKKSKDLLKFLRSSYDNAMERTEDIEKRHELTDKYNKALHRLLQLWNKRLSKPDDVEHDNEESSHVKIDEASEK